MESSLTAETTEKEDNEMATITINGKTLEVSELCPATRREARALATRAFQMGLSDFLADEELRRFAGCPEVLRELERQGAGISLSLWMPGEDLDVPASPEGDAPMQGEVLDASGPAVRLGSDVPPEDTAVTEGAA